MTAGILVKLCLYRRPAGIPHNAVVVDVEVAAACIVGNVVVAVAGYSCKAGILVEAVAACGVGYKAEEILCAEIVYPGVRGLRRRDDIFPCLVVV